MKIFREPLIDNTLLSKVKSHEITGDYAGALDLLRPFLPDINSAPITSGITDKSQIAEIYLRCGAVMTYYGSRRQIKDIQENAKNCLTNANIIFTKLKNNEKIAESLNFLALAYYHTGEYLEADVWIARSLARNKEINETRLHTHIIKSMVLLATKDYTGAVNYLGNNKNEFKSGSDIMRGSFALNKSIAYKYLSSLKIAFNLLKIAQYYFAKSYHLPYLASVENSLAQSYKCCNDFAQALKLVDSSINLFRQIDDILRVAWVTETKADILIATGEYEKAVFFTDEALELLQNGDSASIISSIHLTKSIALLKQNKDVESLISLSEAMRHAEITGEAARNKIAETYSTVRKTNNNNIITLYREADRKSQETIKLDLSGSILENNKIHCVLVKNNNLFQSGLLKGMIAIIAECKVMKGDLIAVLDKETDLASIGFYDYDFGMVCLESFSEPELFEEHTVKILGKVVGTCENKPNRDGKFSVNPIHIKK